MAFNTYAEALRVYGKTHTEHEVNCKELKTAKIFATICTERVKKSTGKEREAHIEGAKQKQEQYKDVVVNYNGTYTKCRESLVLASSNAPSSRTKQDVLDTLSSLDSSHIEYRGLCYEVSEFLTTDFSASQDEEEPANI